MRIAVFRAAIILSAILLFTVEPMLGKRILPWFGGSAAVWSTCLVFYQAILLAGYAYANVLARMRNVRWAGVIHALLVALSLFLLPLEPSRPDANVAEAHPVLSILAILTTTAGLPLLLLSATSPLLQQWFERSGSRQPYRLYALSNLASVVALALYPALIEPGMSLHGQALAWASFYVVFGMTLIAAAFSFGTLPRTVPAAASFVLPTRYLSWFFLSACSSALLVSVTSHISANIAAVPFLWVLPLAIYLATFAAAFEPWSLLPRSLLLRLLAVAMGVVAYLVYDIHAVEAMQVGIPVALGGMAVCCYFCHRELYLRRPDPSRLTAFYLTIAAGGACGSILMAIGAPLVLSGVYDLPVALLMLSLVMTAVLWGESRWTTKLLCVAIAACLAGTLVAIVRAYHEDTLSLRRSFYGTLRVVQSPLAGPDQTRTLFHGTINHGRQYLQLPRRKQAGTYYGPDSGIGISMQLVDRPRREVGLVGLGVGTILAYGKEGDHFQIFDINPQVVDIARSLFTYIRESPARTDITLGDGRLQLARYRGLQFDVLALDAFSGDAIPVHLLTEEAMRLYASKLKGDGILAVHISNDYLDLAPVVAQAGWQAGLQSCLVRDHEDVAAGILPSDWVLLSRNASWFQKEAVRAHRIPIKHPAHFKGWTDDRNDLLSVLKLGGDDDD